MMRQLCLIALFALCSTAAGAASQNGAVATTSGSDSATAGYSLAVAPASSGVHASGSLVLGSVYRVDTATQAPLTGLGGRTAQTRGGEWVNLDPLWNEPVPEGGTTLRLETTRKPEVAAEWGWIAPSAAWGELRPPVLGVHLARVKELGGKGALGLFTSTDDRSTIFATAVPGGDAWRIAGSVTPSVEDCFAFADHHGAKLWVRCITSPSHGQQVFAFEASLPAPR